MANPFLINGECSPQSIYAVTTEPTHKVGTRAVSEDGHVFYYASNTGAAALAAGKLMIRPALIPEHAEMDVTTGVAGSYTITGITPGAVAGAANLYADGYCVVTDGAGEGHRYKVRSHAAITASVAFDITLYDPIKVALDTNSTVTLLHNAYANPIISVADQLDVPVGVPCVEIPIGSTTPQYGWLQTWGECGVLQDEAVSVIGDALTIGTSTVGALESDDTATTVSQEFIVGYTLTNAVDTEYSAVYLTIRP